MVGSLVYVTDAGEDAAKPEQLQDVEGEKA